MTTHDVVVFHLQPSVGTGICAYQPGQFVMLRLLDERGALWQQRAYSICDLPSPEGGIELAIKRAGLFTERAFQLKVGDAVELEGPHGIFMIDPAVVTSVVFLAAGIGITPLLCMIRSISATRPSLPLDLLYANKTKDDIPFFTELQKLATTLTHARFGYTVEVGDMCDGVHCESGRISESMIMEYARALPQPIMYFCCGPQPFMDAMTRCLLNNGVDSKTIHFERF